MNTVNIKTHATYSISRKKGKNNERTNFRLTLYDVSLSAFLGLLDLHPQSSVEYISTVSGDVVYMAATLMGNNIVYHLVESSIGDFLESLENNNELNHRTTKTYKNGK